MAPNARLLILPFALLVGACSTLSTTARAPSEAEPAYRRVKFVGRVPPRAEYRCVGRVSGVAPAEGFVDAAHDARVDIKTKAAKLGAAVVKIDRVRVPPVRRHPQPSVMLVGRAYRLVPPSAQAHPRLDPG